MEPRKVIRHVAARDGTPLALHTYLPEGVSSEDALAQRPTVLLTNGIGTTENFWRYLVLELLSTHRVVHWDYRAHGHSGRAQSGDYSLQTQADDLERVTLEVMRHGAADAPPIQVAFSMGVTVLLELFRKRPDLVPAAALLSGGADAPWANSFLKAAKPRAAVKRTLKALTPAVPVLAPAVRAVLGSRAVYPVGRALGLLRERAPREDIERFMKGLTAMDLSAYWATLLGLMEGRGSDVLPHLQVPVLVVGATHDTLVPLAEMERIRSALPHAEYLVVKDAGHAGLLEAGPEVAQAIRRFVDRVAQRG